MGGLGTAQVTLVRVAQEPTQMAHAVLPSTHAGPPGIPSPNSPASERPVPDAPQGLDL